MRVVAENCDPLDVLIRVDIHADRILLRLPISFALAIRNQLAAEETVAPLDDRTLCWSIPWRRPSRRGQISTGQSEIRRDPILIKALRTAHAMLDHDTLGSPVLRHMPRARYQRRLARLIFLSPKLQAAILQGRQPTSLTLAKIVRGKLPACWIEQDSWAGEDS